jgi:hypothetical protein
MRVRSSTPIEIRHCIAYSIGEDEGRPVVWVLGRGGWYEINPSDAYRPIFNKMCEATTMYYSLVDIYTSAKFSRAPTRPGSNLLEALHEDFLQVSTIHTRTEHTPRNSQYQHHFAVYHESRRWGNIQRSCAAMR